VRDDRAGIQCVRHVLHYTEHLLGTDTSEKMGDEYGRDHQQSHPTALVQPFALHRGTPDDVQSSICDTVMCVYVYVYVMYVT